MEDVVLHHRPGSADGLVSLLERTEKLLRPFARRTPPVFAPWFPADRALPLRPARPAPVIPSTRQSLISDGSEPEAGGLVVETGPDPPRAEATAGPPEESQRSKDVPCVPETPNHLRRASPRETPVKRSWSVFAQSRVRLRSSPPPSKQFHHMVSVHGLHLRQRAKWVIGEHNCGPGRDVEQVWRTLIRTARSSGSRLPTCNVNIQRDRAEIWVFCDVLDSEQVGRFLKDELPLTGTIGLSVRRLGRVFSM